MIRCEICSQEFKNNLGGTLTIHLRESHDMSMEDYYVLTVLNGIEPKCKCGLCEERPVFYRGEFRKYHVGHDRYDWQEKRYVELHGQPKCYNDNCDGDVRFHRGKPNKFCSHKCEPSRWNQEKVKKTVKHVYNVDNVFQLESVKKKSKETLISKFGVEYSMCSDEIKSKMWENNLKKYDTKFPQNLPEAMKKRRQTMISKYGVTHYSKTQKFREMSSKNMCKYNENIITNHKIRNFKKTDLYYQSMHEYRFLVFCEKNNILDYVKNSPTFKYLDISLGKWHLPDFKFKEKYIIEIKSTYWLERQGGINRLNEKKMSVESEGYRYIFILDENYDMFFDECL